MTEDESAALAYLTEQLRKEREASREYAQRIGRLQLALSMSRVPQRVMLALHETDPETYAEIDRAQSFRNRRD